ncbi:MAG: IS630 family transposase, partial [Candidatus Cloacimonetes bacterium]|nr:IS630 family transposase [Candidatus Cloacimonadota bacterium]
MVVADECKLQEEPNPFYRWNIKGQTPIVKILSSKKSVSFYGGLSLNDKKEIVHLAPWQNSEETCRFLDELKKKYQNTKKPVLLIWDGASYHKSGMIREWCEDNPGVLELLRFPAYSPDLNPQENVWKALRRNLSEVGHEPDPKSCTNNTSFSSSETNVLSPFS